MRIDPITTGNAIRPLLAGIWGQKCRDPSFDTYLSTISTRLGRDTAKILTKMCMSNDVFYNGGLSDPFSFPFERGASFLLFFVKILVALPSLL